MTPRDRIRLDKGEAAQNLTEPSNKKEIQAQLEQLHWAIAAMQSLDDLGSVEANKAAWNDMCKLSARYEELRKKLDDA